MIGFARLLLAGLLLAFAQPAFPQSSNAGSQGRLCNVTCDPGDDTGEPPPPALALDAVFISQSVPTTMSAGKSYPVSVTMKNVGSETWFSGSGIRLGSQNPGNNTYWGTGRVEPPVVTGSYQTVTFNFTVRAPEVGGSYNFQWQMVKEFVAWFGPKTPNVVVLVKAPNLLPTVTLTSPANGSTVAAPGAVTMTANASDVGGSIASVSFWSNGELVGIDTSAPYSWSLSSMAAGTYQLRAVATDNEGAVASSAAVNLTASGDARVVATRRYVYDGYERLCKTINPESGATIVDYDAAGNVAWSAEGLVATSPTACDRETIANNAKAVRSYDELNRLKSVATPGSTADLQQDYYADGLVKSLSVMNPGKNKVTTSYVYNHRRLLTSESSANGSTLFGLAYAYDGNGNLGSLTYPDNHVVSFAPDAFGRATRVTGTGGVVYAKDITYTAGGAIAGFKYGNDIVHLREGNARQLPSRSQDSYWNGATEVKVIDDRYAYDPNGNVTDITDAAQNGLTTRGMAYDGLDRLKAAVSPLQWGNAVYGYDGLDNLRVADQGARQYRYNYDAANRLANIKSPAGTTLITLAHDARGNTTSKNSQAFVFDAVNRMNQVTGQQVYRYDGQGRRVQTTDADGKTTFWIYSQSGQVLYTSEARRSQNLAYIYLGNTQVATRSVAWGSGTATTRYEHTDFLGSPVAETDILRNIVKRNSYAPYGETFGSTVIDGTGYTGHVMDRATGLTYMQQRYYDPQIARFLSVDPSHVDLETASNFNRYEYANGSPVRFTDPDGRDAWETFRGFISPTGEQLAVRGEPGTVSSNFVGAVKQTYNTAVAISTMSRGALPDTVPIANNQLEGAALAELVTSVSLVAVAPTARPTPAAPQLPAGLKILGSAGGPGAGKRFSPLVQDLAEAQAGSRCVFCGRQTTREPGPAQRNTDHSHPKSQGGNNTLENAQNTCRQCNLQKGASTTVQFLQRLGVIFE